MDTNQKITELEAKLQKQTFLFKRSEELAQMGWWSFDLASQKITWTNGIFRLFDRDPALGEPEFETLTEIIHPDDREIHNTAVAQTIETGSEKFQINYRIILSDGSIRYLQTQGESEFDEQGNITGLQGIVLDLTREKRIKEDLQGSTREYQSTIEGLVVGVVVHAADTHILFSNPEASNILGLTVEQMLGKEVIDPTWRFVYEDLSTMKIEDYPVSKVLSTKNPLKNHVLGIVRPDKEYITWALVNAMPLLSHDGEIEKIIVNFVNITERKQAMEALWEREGQYRMLFDKMLNGFALHEIIVDEDGKPCDYRFIEINPTFQTMTGITPEMVIGKRVLEALPGTKQYWIDIYGKVALTGEPIRFENYAEALDKHFEVFAFCPKKGRFATIFIDITERKNAVQELRKSEKLLSDMATNIPGAVYQFKLDTEGQQSLPYVSDGWLDLFGISPEEAQQNSESTFAIIHPDDLPQVAETITISAQTLEPWAHQYRIVLDGKTKWILGHSMPEKQEDGAVLWNGVLIDITPQKEAETKHEQLQQDIIKAQQYAIQELSVPIIPVMDQIIIMPLIGSIDSMRASDLMRALLAGISEYRAKVVILDITGVAIVDTGVAAHLDKTIQAARLKGARTIVTGISDAVAETIIDLGIDWSKIETVRDLQTGLMVALQQLGFQVTQR
ncbi:PAS domain-containing protein [Anaerolineales bacterium HSG6]|nr:PAS domain-containing protein [Anaerolineales bacterium HSG6]MDM8532323.1 PAS domain-containing protein [Anaerolineales bacterium HSG25]